MDKMKMRTPDLTDENIERLAALFPNVVTEIKGDSGVTKKAIDFDLLKQVLSKAVVEGDDERYRLDWPGKKASLLKANIPITKTLRPCRDESVNFDTTENLYIEGDNFEVLKILQESYLGKVKMIYIDPPYNTGNDFIYKDDFAQSKEDYEEVIGVEDERGGKLFKNTDSNGRFHSDWLSMIYERLIVARDLLKDDGVIFISIDDNETHNLRKVCDEVFGERNFIAQFVWEKTFRPSNYTNTTRRNTEYIVMYSKSRVELVGTPEDAQGDFSLTKKKHTIQILKCPANYVHANFEDGIYAKGDYKHGYELLDDIIVDNGKVTNEFRIKIAMSIWKQDYFDEEIKNGVYLVLKNKSSMVLYARKTYKQSELKPTTLISNKSVGDVLEGNKEINNIFKRNIFDYPKPSSLIKCLISYISFDRDDYILDFYSGSATTAHAVMQINAEDGGKRKFVMVQLPEKTDENSEAYKAGYKTIAEIGKERIRRVGKKILEELKAKNKQLELGQDPVDASKFDIGFRVYKTDESNMKDVFYHPAKLDQKQLTFAESNIKEDRTPEDLLTQVILDLGLELSLPIETKKIGKNTVFIVQTNALVACFDNDIDFKIVDTIAGLKPFKVVFKDASFKDDKDRINVNERFKRLSPETKVTVI